MEPKCPVLWALPFLPLSARALWRSRVCRSAGSLAANSLHMLCPVPQAAVVWLCSNGQGTRGK